MARYKKIEDEDKEREVPMYMRTTEELKDYIGDFENQLKENAEKKYLKNPPSVGQHWLRDRGLTMFYLKYNWLSTWLINGKRFWAITEKYVKDGIPEKESALNELRGRRQYAEEEDIMNGEPIIRDMYLKEKREKIGIWAKHKK